MPDLWYLRDLTVNKVDVDDLISKLNILLEKRNENISIFFCKSVIDTFKYVFTTNGWLKINATYKLSRDRFPTRSDLCDGLCAEYLSNNHNLYCRNKELADMIDYQIKSNIHASYLHHNSNRAESWEKILMEKLDQILDRMR
jgi:hypothetical protein